MARSTGGEGELGLWSVAVGVEPVLAGFTAALADRGDLAVRTRETYRERVAHFLAWVGDHDGEHGDALEHGGGRAAAVTAYVRAAVDERAVLGATVNLSITVLGIFYTWLGLGLGPPATPRPPTPRCR